MAELTPFQIQQYAKKWLNGNISSEELNLLEQWYNKQPVELASWDSNESENQVKERLFKNIITCIEAEKTPVVSINRNSKFIWRIAVAVVFLISISIGIRFWLQSSPKQQIIAKSQQSSSQSRPAQYTRYIELPDKSVVILYAGSVLNFPEDFKGSKREVSLEGEAYFDIKNDPSKPFIIHTGKVKTTVLGTAFNIKAYSDKNEITVSVTRGKVKVEDEEKLLAILLPNNQIVYNTKSSNLIQNKVDAMAIVSDWTNNNMDFNSISFQSITEELSLRYNVTIEFKNESLKQCPIKAFFNGTESLNEILDVLCTARNATYTIKDNKTVIIDGNGCE